MFCPSCVAENADNAAFCTKCGMQLAPSDHDSAPTQSDPILEWLVPVGRSGFAIAAGYFALFSLLAVMVEFHPLFGAPAPLALLFGILALFDIKKHPRKTGKGRAWFGIVLGGAFTVLGIVLFADKAVG